MIAFTMKLSTDRTLRQLPREILQPATFLFNQVAAYARALGRGARAVTPPAWNDEEGTVRIALILPNGDEHFRRTALWAAHVADERIFVEDVVGPIDVPADERERHNAWVSACLDKLEADLPTLVEQLDQGEFFSAFAVMADNIVAHAGEEEGYARGRIDCMLKNAGMIPGEDEEEPCT